MMVFAAFFSIGVGSVAMGAAKISPTVNIEGMEGDLDVVLVKHLDSKYCWYLAACTSFWHALHLGHLTSA